jgi:hypothetical protein
VKTHNAMQCAGEPCVVHNPSDHHMKGWPIVYRTDRAVQMPPWALEGAVVGGPVFVLAERICTCGIGHPDPDAMAYARREGGAEFARAQGVHGCCGHCRSPRDPSKPITPEETAEIAVGAAPPGWTGAIQVAHPTTVTWRHVSNRVFVLWDEPIWLALTPRRKTDGVSYPVVLGYFDGDSFTEYNGLSLDDEVTHWAEVEYPGHPTRPRIEELGREPGWDTTEN